MLRNRPFKCHLGLLFSNHAQCHVQTHGHSMEGQEEHRVPQVERRDSTEHLEERRGGTDPYGQDLPDWLTWTEYATTVGGQVTTTGFIQQLPLTYYGPSIPLGSGWVYGGLTSPTQAAQETETDDGSLSTSMVETPSDSVVGSVNSGLSSETLPSSTIVKSPSPSTSPFSSFQRTLPLSSSSLVSSPPSSAAPSLSSFVDMSSSSTSTYQTTNTVFSSTSQHSTMPTQPGLPHKEDDTKLIPLLPAVLVPLLVLLAIILITICLCRKRRKPSPATSTPRAHRLPNWLGTVIRNPSLQGYSPTDSPPTPTPKSYAPLPPAKSPDEKSALLPGFTPHHHHHHHPSSLFGVSGIEQDDELGDLVLQNQTLLQKLSLGLGWLTPSSSSSEPRRASGHTLEKGMRRSSYTAIPVLSRHRRSGTETTGNEQSSKTNGSSAGNDKHLSDEKLFYRVPQNTASSRGSSSGSGSRGSRSSSSRGAGPSRRSSLSRYSQPPLPEGATGPHRAQGDSVSLGVPETPVTGEMRMTGGDLGESGGMLRWRESAERLRFPIPPETSVQALESHVEGSKRKSGLTASTEFHTTPSAPPDQVANDVMNGHPIGRTDRGYRHVSVSAFGSHPTTPWDPPIQSIWHDNSSHDNSEGHSNEDTSITSPHQPNPALSSAMSSSESHSPTRGITGRDALAPMQGLFALTPPQSARSGDQAADYRTSFAGEPLFDFQMLQTPGETTVRQRNVSEFGQTLRTGPDVSPTVLHRGDAAGDGSSEVVSLHSQREVQAEELDTSAASSGSHGSEPEKVSRAFTDRVLRGRRSQAQIVPTSALTSNRVDFQSPSGPQEEASKAGRGWFGRLRG